MKLFATLLMYGFLFESNPTVFILDNSCGIVTHRSAPAIKVEPTGLIKFFYGRGSVEAIVVDDKAQEVHVLEKGKYHFFEHRNHILYKTSQPTCNPL